MGEVPVEVHRLVLWDVDRTLVEVEGLGRLVYEDAFQAVFGRPLEQLADMAGRTDRYIIEQTLALHGIHAHDELLDPFYKSLGRAVRSRRGLLRAQGRALAGARAALDAVARVPSVVQSVVTGNTREIAAEKLSAFGLDEHLDFEVGGYGNDATVRRELVRLAWERVARKYRVDLPWEHVVVVGDTEHDLAGALENSAVAIGVATGATSADELDAAGASLVLDDLTDTAAVLQAVLMATSDAPT